ncbi:MAG TPA: molybdenum ABC transporter ATP-binding protein, partial [Pusillimonas sp.]|nr:molybdenum ABC transporter ATP-binding protein [Pusillimonas sp.]
MSLVQNHIRLTLPRADFLLNVDLTLPTTGITVLFGVSGSGKTSILRCVAGLERGKGLVRMGGDVWQDNARKLFQPTWKRPIGYVFQEASLF